MVKKWLLLRTAFKNHRNLVIQETFVHFIHLKTLFIIVVQTGKCPGCVFPCHQLMTGIINPNKG